MPKLKSKGAVKKRFRITKSGKVKSSRPRRGHMHASKSAKHSRKLRAPLYQNTTWSRIVRGMMGGS